MEKRTHIKQPLYEVGHFLAELQKYSSICLDLEPSGRKLTPADWQAYNREKISNGGFDPQIPSGCTTA